HYFLAALWHGRLTFRASDPGETQQAALLTLALRHSQVDGQPAQALWDALYQPTAFFVGHSDDLTPTEYGQALDAAYGPLSDPRALADPQKFAAFQQAVAALRPPQILGLVLPQGTPTPPAATQGLRLLGQRFVPDAFVFSQLLHTNVPNRFLPKALDVFAALGSARAQTHLAASGDTALPRYAAQLAQLQQQLHG